jgi:CRP-like cAMP-binding protein
VTWIIPLQGKQAHLCSAYGLRTVRQGKLNKKACHIDCEDCAQLQIAAFRSLKPEELRALRGCKSTNSVRRKQIIFHENDSVRGLHCIHEGKVKLYKTLDDGSTQILKIAKAADLIGYRGLIGDGKYIATCEALEDSLVCFIPKERVFELISHNPRFAMDLMAKIAEDISEAENRSINFLQKSSKERLAGALLFLEKSFGLAADGSIDLLLTREELAGLTGNVMETAIRILHGWEAEGIVALNRKRIRITDRDKMISIAGVNSTLM